MRAVIYVRHELAASFSKSRTALECTPGLRQRNREQLARKERKPGRPDGNHKRERPRIEDTVRSRQIYHKLTHFRCGNDWNLVPLACFGLVRYYLAWSRQLQGLCLFQ